MTTESEITRQAIRHLGELTPPELRRIADDDLEALVRLVGTMTEPLAQPRWRNLFGRGRKRKDPAADATSAAEVERLWVERRLFLFTSLTDKDLARLAVMDTDETLRRADRAEDVVSALRSVAWQAKEEAGEEVDA